MRIAVVEHLLLALLHMVVAPQARIAVGAVAAENCPGAVRLGLVGHDALHTCAVMVPILEICQFQGLPAAGVNERCKS